MWSVDTATGGRRLELELRNVAGEAEGLHTLRLLNGELHWLIAPLVASNPSFGPEVGLLHFARASGRPGLKVRATATARSRVSVLVTRRGEPVKGASVSIASGRTRTDGRGRATVRLSLAEPGRYAALARKGRLRGLSARLALGR